MAFALRKIGLRIALAVIAGLIFGVIDLWLFELSWRGLGAGIVAGTAYFLVVLFAYDASMRRIPWLVAIIAIVAGVAGASSWWFVTRAGPLWLAITVGSVLALAHFAGDGQFRRAR